MLIKDFIQRIRVRLKDTGSYKRYSDDELMDTINQEQNIIIYEFDMNVGHFTKQISPDDNALSLPKVMLKVVHSKLDNTNLSLRNYKEHLQNPQSSVHLMSFSNMQTVAVVPKDKANGNLELWANLCVFHKELDESLFVNDLFVSLLLYGCLRTILQAENSEVSLQKLAYYESMYKKEMASIKDISSRVKEENIFYSKVNKV